MLKAFFFLALLLQDPIPEIEFPEGMRPPAPQIEETPEPPPVDAFAVDELYLIQADSGLHIIPSPSGIVQVTSAQSGSVIFSKFAGGQGLEERQVTRQHGYILRGLQPGTVELIVLPAGSQDLGQLRRRTLTIRAGNGQDQQATPTDDVGQAFREYEKNWRSLQRDLANRLDRGEITTEEQAFEWFLAANTEARRIAFTPLLQAEQAEFGVEKWTAKKHANYIRRYFDGR
jgi:hypothetical protein